MERLIVKLIFGIAVSVVCVHSDAPTDCKVKIDGPKDFVANGKNELTLNATATNMGLSPDYSWGGLCSSNTDTCTIRPLPDQDGETVFCVATNPDNEQSVNAQYELHLQYPPTDAPMILNSTTREASSPGGNLTSGDELTCTVSGGKPLVTVVNFNCTNPFLPDQKDVNDTYSVSSSVTVDARGATEGPMVCTCFAEWSPEPALYQQEQTMEFTVEMPSPPEERTSAASEMTSLSDEMVSTTTDRLPVQRESKNTIAIGASVGVSVFLILAVICFVCRRKKWNPCAAGAQKDAEAGIVATVVNCFGNWREKWNPCATGTQKDTPASTATQHKMSEGNENTEEKQAPAVYPSLSVCKLDHEQTSSTSKDPGTGKATEDEQPTSSGTTRVPTTALISTHSRV